MQTLNLSLNKSQFDTPSTPQFGKLCDSYDMKIKIQKPTQKIQKSKVQKEKKNQNKVYCQICNKSYTNKYSLHTHLKTLHKVKPHNCEVCSESFWEVKEHKTHMETFHLSYLVEQTKLQKPEQSKEEKQTKLEDNVCYNLTISQQALMKQSIQTEKTDLSISSDEDDMNIENHHLINNDKIYLSQQLYCDQLNNKEEDSQENIDLLQFCNNEYLVKNNLESNESNSNQNNNNPSNDTNQEISSIISQIQLPVLNPFNFELNY